MRKRHDMKSRLLVHGILFCCFFELENSEVVLEERHAWKQLCSWHKRVIGIFGVSRGKGVGKPRDCCSAWCDGGYVVVFCCDCSTPRFHLCRRPCFQALFIWVKPIHGCCPALCCIAANAKYMLTYSFCRK